LKDSGLVSRIGPRVTNSESYLVSLHMHFGFSGGFLGPGRVSRGRIAMFRASIICQRMEYKHEKI